MSGRTAKRRRREQAATASTPTPAPALPQTTEQPVPDPRDEPAPFETRVQEATELVNALAQTLLEDLDPIKGGFGPWTDQLPDKERALISEYLFASVQGLSHALLSASLQVDVLNERSTADDTWLRAVWKTISETVTRATSNHYLAASKRGPIERRRDLQKGLAVEHGFYHLAQATDRLAACIIGIAGLNIEIIRADWSHIEGAVNPANKRHEGFLQPAGTPGRAAQDAVLKHISNAVSEGPNDWLPWLLRQRNTMAHRAPKMTWNLMVEGDHGNTRMVTPLYRQPGWSEVEAMVRNKERINSPDDLLLMQDTAKVLEALVQDTAHLVRAALLQLTDLWAQRKTNPTLIQQPVQQWKNVLTTEVLHFPGYDLPRLKVQGDRLYVNPANGHRLRASKVMEADSDYWHGDK